MPSVDGMEVLRRVALDLSGRAGDHDHGLRHVGHAVEAVKAGAFDYIEKPFEQEQIRLDRRQGGQAGRAPTAPQPQATAIRRRGRGPLRPRRQEPRDAPRSSRSSRRSPTPRRPCSSPARRARARSWSPRRCTSSSSRSGKPFIKINCAAIPKDSDGVRAVRLRARRLHRRHQRQARALRAGRRRHAVPRRDRRDPGRDAGQAPARDPGERVRARRRHQDHQGRRPPDHRHQPRPREGDRSAATSARISSTASTSCRCASRRCASALGDIPLLVQHIVRKFNERLKKNIRGIADEALAGAARPITWPGNIRELENVLERTILFCTAEHIERVGSPPTSSTSGTGRRAARGRGARGRGRGR